MKVIAAARKTGKTQQAVDWVLEGERVHGYPGWSRVLLVHNLEEVVRLRDQFSLDPKQIFSLHEWQRASNVHPETEVAIDNVDMYLHNLIGRHGVPTLVTITGEVAS
jgi:hypothetical protein